MEDEDLRRLISIQKCDAFLREYQFPGAAIELAAKRLAVINAELQELRDRESMAKGRLPWDGREIRKRCRNLREEHLKPISKAAKAIDEFVKYTPGAALALKVPHKKDSAELHVAAGVRFTKFMKEHRAEFLRETGFDRDFLGKLRATTRELRIQSTFASRTRTERSSLLREIKVRLTKGRRQIDLLKVLLEPLLIERKLQTYWAMASRVGPKKGRPRDTPEQRAAKRALAPEQRKERIEQRRLKRERQLEARRARRAQQKQL